MLWCMVRNTPKAMALGTRLRAAREAKNLSQRTLAKQLGIDNSVLSRHETGERPPGPEEVAGILAVLGVNGAERDEIIDLARDPSGTTWLAVSLPEQRVQLAALLDFEQLAATIIDVAPLVVPGLLQTSNYTRAIMRTGNTVADNEVETRVAVRMGRRDVLTRDKAPVQFTALIGEGALRQMVGGPEVMAAQLQFLLKMGALPNVDIRAVPFATSWHPGLDGPFTLLTIDKTTSVVHLENRRSGLFLQEQEDVAAYKEAVDEVLHVAMSTEQTAALIASEAERMMRSE